MQPVITCIYLCMRRYAASFLYILKQLLQNKEQCHIVVTEWRGSLQRGTQQEYNYAKHRII